MTDYGPHNPHPLSQMRTELVWEGKYDEFGQRREVDVAGLAMPLQRIETIDEPRSRAEAQGLLFDEQKAHQDDFRNHLIWGDNKLIMASLLKEFRGAIDTIYIDPPFDVGADFRVEVQIGDDNKAKQKEQSLLELVAYRDMWGRGVDSYLSIIYERLTLMKELLKDTGSIFVHCDWRLNSSLRLLLDDVFGKNNFLGEVKWKRAVSSGSSKSISKKFSAVDDSILHYNKGDTFKWIPQYLPYSEKYKKRFTERDERGRFYWDNLKTYSQEKLESLIADDRIKLPLKPGKNPRYKNYLHEGKGVVVDNMWTDIPPVNSQASQDTGYDTQKPEELISRIITATTEEGDLIADFFCGSGTTITTAEKLGRKWIGADLGRFAIHTSRKRLIGTQRELNDEGKPYRSFDVFNLGRYERQWWQQDALKGADDEHLSIVLNFFRAEVLTHAPSPLIHGRKGNAFVHVDGIDSIFTREEASDVAKAIKAAGGREVHCLAWDFEMDLRQTITALETELEIKIRLHRIPREIMEKNRTEVPPFFEVALLEAEPVIKKSDKGHTVDIKLTNFLPSLTEVPSKELEALQERAVESGFDFIDFWAVDFDWSPDQPFNHHWQDYRTRKDRTLKTVSDASFVYDRPGKHTSCVKVVDVFGCDTSITVEVEV